MRVELVGFPIDNITKIEALDKIEGFVSDSVPHFSVAINPEKLMKAVSDRELASVIKASDLNFVDGVGVAWASIIFYHKKVKERITGIDLMGKVLAMSEKKSLKVYFLGAEEKTIQKAVNKIKGSYPALIVVGFHNGFFNEEEEIVNDIRSKSSDVIFVGMGSPKQEKFIYSNLQKMNARFAMGVGGSFNVYAGEFRRAPQIIQSLGLEWLYRFILDPKRFPRIIKLPQFLLLVAKHPERQIIKDEVNFLGIKISNRDMASNIKIAESFIHEGNFHIVVTLNGEMASRALNDMEFLNILRESDLVIPDGIGVIWGARRFGERIVHRVPGIEFAWELLAKAEKKGYSVYFLGAHVEVLNSAVLKISKTFPKLKIIGLHHGYLKDCESEIVREMHSKHPDILFVGMGGIKQEKWIVNHKFLDIPLNVGIGGSFDVWAGKIKRAPYVVRKLGLEWLYRTVTQPSRFSRTGSLIAYAFQILFKKVNQ